MKASQIAAVACVLGLAAWNGVQHVQLTELRSADAQHEQALSAELGEVADELVTLAERIENAEEHNVQDRDGLGATIACLRLLDHQMYAFDGGMGQCIDDWYAGNAKGDY